MKRDRIAPQLPYCPAAIGWLAMLALVGALGLAPARSMAQDEAEPEEGPPEPQTVSVVTDDNVILRCTYYPGTEGENTVPVILVHDWEGNRQDYKELAEYLQSLGHAVMVPDLRGHGESTSRRLPNAEIEEINPDRMNRRDFEAMVLQDMQAVKKFLIDRHNERELNIDMLTVVGSEMGAVIALNWCALDWSWPQLPAVRQGRDVKAFVLISPPSTFRGFSIRQALEHEVVGSQLSAMIVVGQQDSRAASNARRLYNTLERRHPPQPETEDERIEKQDLFYVPLETSLQGTELLTAGGLDLPRKIGGFIELRLVRKAERYPWEARRGSLD